MSVTGYVLFYSIYLYFFLSDDYSELKGYSGVSLIHVRTHLDNESDPPSRDKVCRPLACVVLASSETSAQQQYRGVLLSVKVC